MIRKFHGAALAAAFALISATFGFTYSTPNAFNLPKNLTLESFQFSYSGNGSGSTDSFFFTHGYSGAIPAGFPREDGGDKDLPSWTREDSVVPLAYLASPAVGQLGNLRASFPPGIDLHYGLNLEAAFTIQNFNPAIYGGQTFHPNPKYITRRTVQWLDNEGWGVQVAQYEHLHHLHVAPLPNPTKIDNIDGFNYPKHTEVIGWSKTTAGGKPTIQFTLSQPQANDPKYPVIGGPEFTLSGAWIHDAPIAYDHPDNVAFLKEFAAHHPFDAGVSMVPGIGLSYGPDVAAAMTVQNFNPGSIGCQPLAPSSKALTKTTMAWLVQHGWGTQLARYEIVHGLRHVLKGA